MKPQRSFGEAARSAAGGALLRVLLCLMVVGNLGLSWIVLRQTAEIRRQWTRMGRDVKETVAQGKDMGRRVEDLANQVQASMKASLVSLNSPLAPTLPPHVVVRAGHRGTRELCSYSEQELRGILALPHECGWRNKRYYFAGAWMEWTWLHKELQEPKPSAIPGEQEGEEEPECVLACKTLSQLHCSKELPCVHAFYLRRQTPDTLVLRAMYEWNELRYLRRGMPLNSILDAGANIGIASSLIASAFPEATIVSVEASSHNFRVLQKTAAPYPNIIPINAALWPREAQLAIVAGPQNAAKAREWVSSIVEASQLNNRTTIELTPTAVTVPLLVKVFGLPRFDFVKMNIGGGEAAMFAGDNKEDTAWVKKAKFIAVEFHSDLYPGSNNTVYNFFSKLPSFTATREFSDIEDSCIFKKKDVSLA